MPTFLGTPPLPRTGIRPQSGGRVVPLKKYGLTNLRQLWIVNGGDPGKATVAAAIALAESGGNPNAVNDKNSDGSIDRGLWQINSIHGPLSTLDVNGNARAAIKISGNGRNWTPWVAFKNGNYKKELPHGAIMPSPGEILSAPLKPLTDTAKFLGKLNVLFEREWWKRAGLVLFGVVLMLLGAVYIGRTFVMGQVAGVVKQAAKGGS